jgi:hypothetical protein
VEPCDLTNRRSQRPHCDAIPVCLQRHPAVAYLCVVRPSTLHVSIHDYLTHHLRRATFFCWGAAPASITAAFVWRYEYLRIVALVICGCCMVIAYYYHFSARCPRCRTRLLLALASFGIYRRLPEWYKSCPSCGLSFDAQRDGSNRPNQAMQTCG